MIGWRVVVAVHTREVRSALFVALSGEPSLNIAATAGTTAELMTYCRAFRPEAVILENGLPGRPLDEALQLLSNDLPRDRIFMLGEAATELTRRVNVVEDVEDLMAAVSRSRSEDSTQQEDWSGGGALRTSNGEAGS